MVQLSIIIPHYNSTFLLAKLLRSIPYNSAVQVIIIDDNSDEFYQSELYNLQLKNNVEIYTNESNTKGAGASRNIGLEKAVGKWLLFADSDDYFLEGFYSIIKQYFNSTSDVIYFVPTSVNLEDGSTAKRHLPYKNRICEHMKNPSNRTRLNLLFRFSVPWSKLIKRSLVMENKIKFDEVIASNDIMFSAKVGYNLRAFEVSKQEIYCVTRSEGSLTRTMSKPIFESRLMVFINYNNYLRERISKNEYKSLGINGAKYLKMSLNFSVLKCISVYIKLKKEQIKILDNKYLNPFTL